MMHNRLRPYFMIAPAILFLCVFTIYPMGNLVYLGFTDWNIINPVKKFVGWENYRNLISKPDFIQTLLNTAVFTAASVSIILVLALILALFIKRATKINSAIQFAMFLPHIVSLVCISMIFKWLMDPSVGVFNLILNVLGLPGLLWLNSSDTAMLSVILVNIWKATGYITLIVLSALKNVPAEIYEAAMLDYSNRWKTFWKITLPMISPQLFFLLVWMTLSSFKVFDTISIMTGGGPGNSTNVISYYIISMRFLI
jgi:sn-glycerol 3-phosphate transport system permease protein